MADWGRVALAIQRHRGARWTSRGAAAKAAGVGESLWDDLEQGEREGNYQAAKLARIERVLGWHLGTIEAIAGGGPIPELAADDSSDVTELRSRIEAVETKVDRILDRLDGSE